MQNWTQTLGRLFPPFILRVRKQESQELSPMASWWLSWHPMLADLLPIQWSSSEVLTITHTGLFHVSSSPICYSESDSTGAGRCFRDVWSSFHTDRWSISYGSVLVSSACVRVCTQYCLTLWDPMDCSPLVSSVHQIIQARMLDWVATPSSRGSSRPMDQKCLTSPALTGGIFTISAIWEAQTALYSFLNIAKIIFEIFVFIEVSRDLWKMPTMWPSFKCRYLVLSSSDSRLDPTTLEWPLSEGHKTEF